MHQSSLPMSAGLLWTQRPMWYCIDSAWVFLTTTCIACRTFDLSECQGLEVGWYGSVCLTGTSLAGSNRYHHNVGMSQGQCWLRECNFQIRIHQKPGRASPTPTRGAHSAVANFLAGTEEGTLGTGKEQIDWFEQGLTSYQTHYRSYRGRCLQVIWPNQQHQSTEGNQLVLQIRLESHQDHSTMLQ